MYGRIFKPNSPSPKTAISDRFKVLASQALWGTCSPMPPPPCRRTVYSPINKQAQIQQKISVGGGGG